MDTPPSLNSLHGLIRSITGTDPAANVEISETVPDRRRWRLLGIVFTLVTSVDVIDRTVVLIIDDGTNTLVSIPSTTTQAASETKVYQYAQRPGAQVDVGDNFYIPIPYLTLKGGYRIRTATAGRQAADNFGAPQLLIEEWIDS